MSVEMLERAPVEAMEMDHAKESFLAKMDYEEWALTFDDVRLRTRSGRFIVPTEISLETRLSNNINLNVPFVGAAMDTVTGSRMAIEMAMLGGVAVIPALDIEVQRQETRRAKFFMNGNIEKPIMIQDDQSVQSVLNMCDKEQFGFRTFPVIDNEGKFVGLVTKREFKFCEDLTEDVRTIMTPAKKVLTHQGKMKVEGAYKLMQKRHADALPILTKEGLVKSLFTYTDAKRILKKNAPYTTDDNGRLVVIAALPTDPEEAIERLERIRKYIDGVVLDSADGDSYHMFKTIEAVKEYDETLDVIAGNVSEGDSARDLVEVGADAVKVGQGPGSICTTRVVTGIGMPQVTAVASAKAAIRSLGGDLAETPVIADGGIRSTGDISIAVAAGADAVMMGNMLAGTKETPGKIEIRKDNSRWKLYRGQGSASALRDNASSRKRYDTEGQVEGGNGSVLAEGIEAYVPYKGPVADVISMCTKALRKSMKYCKVSSIREHQMRTRFKRITNAGLQESHPHDVQIAS